MIKKRFQVFGMHCVNCSLTVEGAIENLPGVISARASYARQYVDVEYEEDRATEESILAAVQEAGYSAAAAF